MHISAVLSHLGAWHKLQNDYPDEYADIQRVVASVDIEQTATQIPQIAHGTRRYSPQDLHDRLVQHFASLNWRTQYRLRLRNGQGRRYSEINALKNAVGVELTFGEFAFAESNLFVKFPIFVQAHRLQIGCLLIASQSLTQSMHSGVSSYEIVRDRVAGLAPLPLKYPFAIIGIASTPGPSTPAPQVQELTSELDQFLLKTTGYTLSEMALLTESASYDFKVQLPSNKVIAKEVCAFANLAGGGVILLGIDDTGHVQGIERSDLDETQLRIENVVRDNCRPRPTIGFNIFDIHDDIARCLLVVQIDEVSRKPCMSRDRIYIRSGSSARPADTDEVRRLVLSSKV